GHVVGLHYDLATYPASESSARAWLEGECAILARAAGAKVETLVMHNPSTASGADWFREGTPLLHPHAGPAAEIPYLSDSCRAFRDERLLHLLDGHGPDLVQLNFHPELWLDGGVRSRLDYLRDVLTPALLRPL